MCIFEDLFYFLATFNISAVTDMFEMFTRYLFLPSIFCCFSKVYGWMDGWVGGQMEQFSFLGIELLSLSVLRPLVFLPMSLLSSVVDSRDRQERWERGVMTCDKGCMPDWRVHSMHVSHLSRRDTIKPCGL